MHAVTTSGAAGSVGPVSVTFLFSLLATTPSSVPHRLVHVWSSALACRRRTGTETLLQLHPERESRSGRAACALCCACCVRGVTRRAMCGERTEIGIMVVLVRCGMWRCGVVLDCLWQAVRIGIGIGIGRNSPQR